MLKNYGKYKAVAIHDQTVEGEMLLQEIVKRSNVDKGNVHAVMIGLSETINYHLRQGHRVRLPELGLMKFEIKSEKVDDPKDFRPKKHIRGVRLHFLPESLDGSQPLYKDITFEKDKTIIEG